MRLTELTFEEAQRRHPTEVARILARLRNGKSKHKKAKGTDLTWYYEIAVRVEAFSMADLLVGRAPSRHDQMTLDERVDDQVKRTMTSLHAEIGRWWGGESVPNPPEVQARARQHITTAMRDDAAFQALPQEEKDRQAAEALAQLRGTPGFIELRIPRRR